MKKTAISILIDSARSRRESLESEINSLPINSNSFSFLRGKYDELSNHISSLQEAKVTIEREQIIDSYAQGRYDQYHCQQEKISESQVDLEAAEHYDESYE